MSTQSQTQTKTVQQSSFTQVQTGLLQRQCTCGQHTIGGGECAECRKQKQVLQRYSSNQSATAPAQSSTHDVQNTPDYPSPTDSIYGGSRFDYDFSQVQVRTGSQPKVKPCTACAHPIEKGEQSSTHTGYTTLDAIGEELSRTSHPLEGRTRSHMEEQFGVDFSGVRIHTNQEAQLAADVLRADAFTIGAHIFFADGKYDPMTIEGRSLIAHELTHVVQQSNGSVDVHDSDVSDSTTENLEREADAQAQQVTAARNEDMSATHYAKPARPSLTLATTPLGFLLKGSWRKEGQSFIDCVNDCTSSQGFAATLGGILVGICGIVAVLAAAAATPETAGAGAVPAGVLAAAACAGLALGVPIGIMGRCMWDCRD